MFLKYFVALIACTVLSASAHEFHCRLNELGLAPGTSHAERKFTPERQIDILHLSLDVTPNFREQSVSGSATIQFKVLQPNLRELRLNAEDLRVDEVISTPANTGFQNSGTEIIVYFEEPLSPGHEGQVAVHYSAYPKYGLYFRTTEMGFKAEDEHLFTQGEDIEARHWFPCFDHPNEKFTSEVTCRVREDYTVLSNGRLMSEEPAGNGMKAVRWLQDKPHVSYLISLVAGNFMKIEDSYKGLPLAFYTPSSQIELARNSFADTKDMMDFFEREIGVPYPWDKYYQVCVYDFMWGGMENTSVSTLNDRTLFPDETENLRSSQGLVAHELAHQWFGDLVTCQDWSQIWLNEGFATYYSHLYNAHKRGRDDFLYGMWNSARGFINKSSNDDLRPIVFRQYGKPTELFGHLVYAKGGWVLHMLRSMIGEEKFRAAVKLYLERHQFGIVATHDLIEAVEEVTGQSYDRFFDQWVFRPHHPELQASYSWDEAHKMAKLGISQTHALTEQIGLFEFPLRIRFKGEQGELDKVVQITKQTEEFFFPLESAPQTVRIDPEQELLAKITFTPPRAMLLAQLGDEKDMLGRIMAIAQLSKSKDKETISLIADRLNNDPFHGVRVEAAEALKSIHSSEALDALLASAEQQDARVRNKVVGCIGDFYDQKAFRWQLVALQKERNPDIAADLIKGLAAYAKEEVQPILLEHLKSASFKNVVASAAIAAMKEQGDPVFIEPLLDHLRNERDAFTADGYGAALNALAYLGQNEKNKDEVLEFLTHETKHPRQAIRMGALLALGTLKDERAIPVLSRFRAGANDLPETARANRALEAIRAGRPVVNELQTLRTEVLELKKANEELQKSVTELQKRFDAKPPAEPAAQSAPPKAANQ